ncbi:MAG: hypothetical protein MJ203_05765, partial [archaeon]|nr:hypothetical protein [archaeon]
GGSLGSPGSKGGEAKNRLEKMKKLQKYYDKKLSSVDPDKINLVPHLNHSPYDEPKLMFFAHILDLDAVINIDDIYPFVSWSQTYDDIVTHNLKQNTPIQLIEIGEYHTSLVNCLGKTFTWGWDGNGQCAFNISKDKKYLYDNFKPQKGINGNCISGSIEDSNCEGNVDKNIDFEAELENIKNEKEIFEDEDDLYEDVEGFSKNDFTLYYYLDSPIIIDNFNVRKISCGQDNTMVLTKEDKLYVFGANNYFQLGVLKSRNIFSPMSLDNIIKAQQENPAVDLKSKIIEMKFSGKNAILINENGNLIVLSCFCAGITGPDALYRTPIELPVPNIKFSEVECGKDFCLLKSQYGALYTFGTNQFGQLGHGDTEPRNYPTPVRFFLDKKLKVTQITCGYKHAGCRASNKVYIWGCNVCGQLGTGNLDPIYSPKLVELDSSKVQPGILQVSCGLRSTVFLAETRQLFWCGTNGDISKQTKPVEFNYHQKIPELFNYDNHQIVKINHTWSTTMSILYATVTEAGPLAHKLNNPNKMNAILNKLTNCWTSKDLYPPTGEGIDNYISEKHIIMDLKSKKKKRNVEDY